MRTLIVDNGEDYSSHCIYFVETDLAVGFVEKLVGLIYPNGGVAGIATAVEWLDPEMRCSIAEVFGPYDMERHWKDLTREEIESLLPSWDEWVGHFPGHVPTVAKIRARLAGAP